MTITSADLAAARVAWGEGLVAIAFAYENDGISGARDVATKVLDDAYGYALGPVLFKPTMASGKQTFRPTQKGALSYFVGHDPDFPGDAGFGLRTWRSVESETAAEFIDGDVAMWAGWVMMTDADGDVTTVDKSFGYRRDSNGTLRIVLHHSSFPFVP